MEHGGQRVRKAGEHGAVDDVYRNAACRARLESLWHAVTVRKHCHATLARCKQRAQRSAARLNVDDQGLDGLGGLARLVRLEGLDGLVGRRGGAVEHHGFGRERRGGGGIRVGREPRAWLGLGLGLELGLG